MSSVAPIGLFDSGIGGLSVWREVVKLLPEEHIVYFADRANCPYGTKPSSKIIDFCCQITDFLLERACKLIVVACNTATAAAIDHLRMTYDVPFVGMEPAVKPAALYSSSGVVGVLATSGTFNGRLYNETLAKFASKVKIIEQSGDGLVELVEAGKADTPEVELLLRRYIQPMLDCNADYLVLGCTHYPFLIPAIKRIVGNRLTIIDPAPAVAQRIYFLLKQHNMFNTSGKHASYEFFSSGNKINYVDEKIFDM